MEQIYRNFGEKWRADGAAFEILLNTSHRDLCNPLNGKIATKFFQYKREELERAVKTDAVRPSYSSVELTISRKHRENAKPFFENQHWIEQTSETEWKVKASADTFFWFVK